MSPSVTASGRAAVPLTITDADHDEAAFLGLLAAETGLLVPDHRADDDRRRTITRVARRRGQVVGFSQVSMATTAEAVVLDWLYVNHDARRNGVGAALVHDARRTASRAGRRGVDVVAHPVAETFFHRTGAIRVGTVDATTDVPWARPRFFIGLEPRSSAARRGPPRDHRCSPLR